MKKTLIFDLDGTLLDTLKDLQISVNFALKSYNFPVKSLDEVRKSVGNGLRMLIRGCLPEHVDEITADAVLFKMKEYYRLHCHDETKPYPGVPELLERLCAENYRMAIVSNKTDTMVQELHRVFFSQTIAVSVGETESMKRKPAPDMVFEALQQLGAEITDAIYIGDSEVDIQTAENAGLPCLCVGWGFRSEDALQKAGAKMVYHTSKELYEAIKGS